VAHLTPIIAFSPPILGCVSTEQPSAPTVSTEQAATAIRKARGALSRYRVMALITGVTLLVFCGEMIVKYVVGEFVDVDGVMAYLSWIPFAHGWIYVLYLITVLDLWAKMRWGYGRLASMVFAGVVPVMSFVLEKKIHAEAEVKLTALADRYGA
jgi:integral membrane protein